MFMASFADLSRNLTVKAILFECGKRLALTSLFRRMAANSRMSKLADDDESTFTWKVLGGWDFTIGNPEAAQNKVASINTGLREALLEAKESEKEDKR